MVDADPMTIAVVPDETSFKSRLQRSSISAGLSALRRRRGPRIGSCWDVMTRTLVSKPPADNTQLGLGVGIEAGYATLGRIGFEGRHDYGALGPVTNLASRLSTVAATGQILIGQRVFGAVEGAVDASPVGELDLKGFGRPISAYEVYGFRTGG
jgi:class 3 adenylate cyclase